MLKNNKCDKCKKGPVVLYTDIGKYKSWWCYECQKEKTTSTDEEKKETVSK